MFTEKLLKDLLRIAKKHSSTDDFAKHFVESYELIKTDIPEVEKLSKMADFASKLPPEVGQQVLRMIELRLMTDEELEAEEYLEDITVREFFKMKCKEGFDAPVFCGISNFIDEYDTVRKYLKRGSLVLQRKDVC